MDYPQDPNDPDDPRLVKRDRSPELAALVATLVRHFDAKPLYRSYNCWDCGAPIQVLTYASGMREMMDATTYEPHCCPRPVRIEPPTTAASPPPPVRRDPPPRPPSNPPNTPSKKDNLILI
jgi:hypothetical protein